MPQRPRLQGLAKQMILQHLYQTQNSQRPLGFYRFLLLNSSSLATAHNFLSRMRLSIAFMEYIICPRNCRFLQIRSDSIIIALLRLGKPSEFRLVFSKEYNGLEREWIQKAMWRLMPFLGGVRKLEMPVDSNLLFILNMLAEQLEELWCADKLLNSKECSLLNLRLLKLGVECSQMSYRTQPVLMTDFRYLFRHKIQRLDLSNFNFDSFCDRQLSQTESGQHSISSLRIQINEKCLLDKVLPFVLSLHERMPKFEELDVQTRSFHFKLDESKLSAGLLNIHGEIMEFKEKTEHFLKKLTINFDGFEFALHGRIEQNWLQKIKETGHFHFIKCTENTFDNTQIVKLHKIDAPLHLNIRFELNIDDAIQWDDGEGLDYD
ncbi:hypothetical protein M3Y97_00663900 [Aphelenchoides bicaudatus]|nr:hypothetical protein M3Y97_00663900 [Aphelenchoides bicaudatus]